MTRLRNRSVPSPVDPRLREDDRNWARHPRERLGPGGGPVDRGTCPPGVLRRIHAGARMTEVGATWPRGGRERRWRRVPGGANSGAEGVILGSMQHEAGHRALSVRACRARLGSSRRESLEPRRAGGAVSGDRAFPGRGLHPWPCRPRALQPGKPGRPSHASATCRVRAAMSRHHKSPCPGR